MSAVITRMVFAAGVVVVGALFAYFQASRPQAESHEYHEPRRGSRRRRLEGPEWNNQGWGTEGGADEEINSAPRPGQRSSRTKPPLPNAREFKCSICHSSWAELGMTRAELLATECGHVFCGNCIRQHLGSESGSCPLCRKPVTPGELRRVKLPLH